MYHNQKSNFEKLTLNAVFDMAKDEYKKATGKDATVYGLIEDIKKAIEVLKNIVTLACTSKEDIDKFNFWANLLTWFIDVRKKGRRVNVR
jgi:hypothetical protein